MCMKFDYSWHFRPIIGFMEQHKLKHNLDMYKTPLIRAVQNEPVSMSAKHTLASQCSAYTTTAQL